jgi:hypothetical protein
MENSTTCKVMNSVEKFISLSEENSAKFDKIISREAFRWVLLFLAVVGSYGYMIYYSFTDVDKIPNPSEQREIALLFNPALGGYNQNRGDPNSPPLFKWTESEYIVVVSSILISIFLFWYVIINRPKELLYIRVIQYLLVISNLVVLIFFIPVNDFHRRMLYNLRSLMVTICNNSLEELWMAFLFIVVLPLPGSKSSSERITWLGLKLGIFYMVQNFMLGSPNYEIEAPEKNVILPNTTSQYIGYGVFVVILSLLILKDHCVKQK